MATATAKKKSERPTESLVEFVTSTDAMKVDREKGIIYGVKILGGESKNGRTYTEAAMSKAASLYEGAKANINHPKGSPKAPRDVEDRLGSFRAVEHRSGQGLYGNLHYNPKCRVAEALAWAAENSPSDIGFSHNVDAQTSRTNGRVIVESITRVQSVDLVADPATTNGLYEHTEEPEMSLAEMTLEQIFAARPELKDAVLTEAKQSAEAVAKENELKALKEELDAFKTKEKLAARKAAVDAKLTEAKLPQAVLSAVFLESCYEADDAKLAKLIEDRAALAKLSLGQKPKSTEQTPGSLTEEFKPLAKK